MPSLTRQLLCALAFATLLVPAIPAQAQTGIRLASLHIDLWPEFDQPSMLVILDGVLRPDVALPAAITVRLPSGVESPNAVAMRDASGQLVDASYTTSRMDDTLAVVVTAEFPEFRVEYYDARLSLAGSARSFAFQWSPEYGVDSATVRVQEPVGARQMAFEPALASSGAADFGLNYYGGSLGPLAAGQAVTLQLSYTKADARLSVESVSASAPVGAPAAAPQPASASFPWPVALAAGGGLLIGGGVYYWNQRRAARSKVKSHPRRHRARAAPSAAAVVERQRLPSAARFCTQCGQALLTGDRFCRNCGARAG